MFKKETRIDYPVFIISGGLLLLFIIVGFINQDFVTNAVNESFAFSVKYFGGFYQFILLGTFFYCVIFSLFKIWENKIRKNGETRDRNV